MSYRVKIEEIFEASNLEVERREPITRFEQVVDAIDLRRVFQAINAKPRKVRVRKAKGASE
jgi:hypothetical protein